MINGAHYRISWAYTAAAQKTLPFKNPDEVLDFSAEKLARCLKITRRMVKHEYIARSNGRVVSRKPSGKNLRAPTGKELLQVRTWIRQATTGLEAWRHMSQMERYPDYDPARIIKLPYGTEKTDFYVRATALLLSSKRDPGDIGLAAQYIARAYQETTNSVRLRAEVEKIKSEMRRWGDEYILVYPDVPPLKLAPEDLWK